MTTPETPIQQTSPVRAGRVIALVLGCLLVVPAIAALLGGGALALAYAFGRDDGGFFGASLDRLESPTVAITAEEIDFTVDPGTPGWVIDALDADVRLRVTGAESGGAVFVGIGPESDVDEYLVGVAHDEVRDLTGGRRAVYRSRSGGDDVAAPTDESFWVASASGPGTQELLWKASEGRWAVVVMNADGAPGVSADVDVGVRAGFVLPLALILLGLGVVATAGAVALIFFGARGLGSRAATASEPGPETEAMPAGAPDEHPASPSPLVLEATLDSGLSRWLWLVKWFLAIPHYIILVFLWIALFVLTVVAGFAILFTGRYPRGIFDFNVGVLRWSWRVGYYATNGGIGTDRYPPFSLAADDSYPARLDLAYPDHLSRGLVLVKWWLLAIPQYLIVGILVGGAVTWTTGDDSIYYDPTGGGGLLGVLVLIAGAFLLFKNRYPRPLFDLIVGLNRWVYRVTVYAALMTDEYPPFRLDQGGSEPVTPGEPGPAIDDDPGA